MEKDKSYFVKLKSLYNLFAIAKMSTIIFVIVLIIDVLNIPTIICNFGSVFLLIGIVIFLLIKFFELHIIELVFVKAVNYFDSYNLSAFLSLSLLLMFYGFTGFQYQLYKLVIIKVALIISFVLIVCRWFYINISYKKVKNKNEKTNVFDLKDLYNNNINLEEGQLIFVDEKDVDYDLLDRTEVINELYQNLLNCKTNGKFVISLCGDWGSGKTTIIKNVKKIIANSNNKELVIIDSFDPWIYEDKGALFRAMFDSIMSEIGINFSINEINSFLSYYLSMIFDDTKFERFKPKHTNNIKEINRIKSMINSYLELNGKRLVFIVDNIERANKHNILLLFRMISTVLDFNRTIYLLAFDKIKMEKIFEADFDMDFEYLDKIIQLELELPTISKDKIHHINEVVIGNIMQVYGMSDEDMSAIKGIITEYSSNINDLRDLKRNINSVLSFNFNSNNYLNRVDSFIIKYISIKNKKLIESFIRNCFRYPFRI
ncbi:MAG: KAP family NTPase [Lachnospiraceae bacterium]|nr:KAP family NTPase [Lachnospiraceae bacterium]